MPPRRYSEPPPRTAAEGRFAAALATDALREEHPLLRSWLASLASGRAVPPAEVEDAARQVLAAQETAPPERPAGPLRSAATGRGRRRDTTGRAGRRQTDKRNP